MQFPIDNILIVPSKNHFMNEIGDFVTVYTQIPTSNLKITCGYLCVNCDEIPNFIHKMIFRGNNQNIVYWKLHVFSYPTLLKQTVQKNLIPIGYIFILVSFRIYSYWSLSTIKYNPARFVFT